MMNTMRLRREMSVLVGTLVVLLLFPSLARAQGAAGNELVLQFVTGGDDLRGGNDNVHVLLLLRTGTPLRFDNVNNGKKWSNNSTVAVTRPLPGALRFDDILGVRLETTASGGIGGDNWNLDRLEVSARLRGETRQLFRQAGTPLFRFTGDRRVREFSFSAAPIPPSPPRRTRFDPALHGFKFVNSFKNIFISEIDYTTSGLCGGMAYAALDYFNAGKPIPPQDFMPAEGMPLQSYIYGRQVNSIVANVDKWGEYGFNPGGARNREFFNWGLQTGSGRLGELRSRIDRGQPVPLGLQDCGKDCGCPGGCPGSHQVLAIGYELGRYKGDLGENIEDFSLFVYDPNVPGRVRTLKPNVAGAKYCYKETPGRCWRSYFVDLKYARSMPPTITAAPNELIVQFGTGGDDLRGGNDNVHLSLLLRTGTPLRFTNVNGRKRWINNSSQTVSLPLPATVRAEDIAGVLLETTFGGGVGSDNWNLDSLMVKSRIGTTVHTILTQSGRPLVRFTGNQRTKEFRR